VLALRSSCTTLCLLINKHICSSGPHGWEEPHNTHTLLAGGSTLYSTIAGSPGVVADAVQQDADRISAISCGLAASLVLFDNGTVAAFGILGNLLDVPVNVQSGGVTHVSAGQHALAIVDGEVVAWGDSNLYGELDVPPAALTGATYVSAGYNVSMAVVNGGVVAWGDNTNGLLDVPTQALAGSGVEKVVAGWSHALALRSDGSVVAWGDNSLLQVGSEAASSGW
jgi:hypothetical protein